jgi:hypothetical protein
VFHFKLASPIFSVSLKPKTMFIFGVATILTSAMQMETRVGTSRAHLLRQLREISSQRKQMPGTFGVSYGIDGSKIEDYDIEFRSVMRGAGLVALVRGTDAPVVVDLMASPSTLADLFQMAGVVGGIGIAVNYQHYPSVSYDWQTRITDIHGDIALKKTWRWINLALRGRKADLVLERAIGGMENIPWDPVFYGTMLRRAWQLLNPDGGTLLFQAPPTRSLRRMGVSGLVPLWMSQLNENNISAAYHSSMFGNRYQGSQYDGSQMVFRLTRRPESPDILPLDR